MDIAPPPCLLEDIEPPPCLKNKRQLKKLRYRANKRASQKTMPPTQTFAELKDRLHKRIGMNKKGLSLLEESMTGNQFFEIDKVLKKMGINDEATKNLVRQMLQKYQEEK